MMFFIQLLNTILIIISKFSVKFCCCNRSRYLNTSCSYIKLILFQCIYDFSSNPFSMEFWQNENSQQNDFCLTSPETRNRARTQAEKANAKLIHKKFFIIICLIINETYK